MPMMTDEEARQAGWIDWDGGECPVHPDTLVRAAMKCGGVELAWAKHFKWDAPSEVVSYRIVRRPGSEQETRPEFVFMLYDYDEDGPVNMACTTDAANIAALVAKFDPTGRYKKTGDDLVERIKTILADGRTVSGVHELAKGWGAAVLRVEPLVERN